MSAGPKREGTHSPEGRRRRADICDAAGRPGAAPAALRVLHSHGGHTRAS